jgi:hypothetical protein
MTTPSVRLPSLVGTCFPEEAMLDVVQASLLPDNSTASVGADPSLTGEAAAVSSEISPEEAPRARRPRRSGRSTPTSPDGPVDPVLASLFRLEGLVSTLVRVALRPVLTEELKEPSAQVIYEGTGEKTAREIAIAAGVGVATVSRTWTRWAALGLIVKDGTGYRRAF